MAAIAIPTKNPGEVYIPALGKAFQQIELREDDHYDTVEVASGSLAAGTEYFWFRDTTNKNEQHISIPTPKRIQSGDEVAVFRIGIHPREAQGNTLPIFNDYRKVIGNAHVELKFNRRVITTGPIVKYPSGYGVGGLSDESSATAVSIGVPSVAAAPTLFVPQQLKDDDDLAGKLRFPGAAWLTSYGVAVMTGTTAWTMLLHGVMKAPLGK